MPLAPGYMAFKDAIVAATGWPRDGLHVAGGLLFFVIFALTTPSRARSLAAWSAVFAIALANELLDLGNELAFGPPSLAESWHDLAYTMALPTLALLGAHLFAAYGRTGPDRPKRRAVAWVRPSTGAPVRTPSYATAYNGKPDRG